jgi:hypothetical protein
LLVPRNFAYLIYFIILLKEPDFSEDQEEKKKDSKKSKANLLERRSTRTRKCISYRYKIKSIKCFYN